MRCTAAEKSVGPKSICPKLLSSHTIPVLLVAIKQSQDGSKGQGASLSTSPMSIALAGNHVKANGIAMNTLPNPSCCTASELHLLIWQQAAHAIVPQIPWQWEG